MTISHITDGEDVGDAVASINAAIDIANFAAGGPLDLNGAVMVHFPSDAFLEREEALEVSNSHVGTMAFIVNDCGLASATVPLVSNDSAGVGAGSGVIGYLILNTTSPIFFLGLGGAPQSIVRFTLNNWRSGQNNLVLCSWNTAPDPLLAACAVNGVLETIIDNPSGGFVVDYTAADDPSFPGFYGVNSDSFTAAFDVGNVFLDVVHTIVTDKKAIARSDVEKFIKNGQVQPLGSDGSTPFGVAPAIYFTGNAAAFPTNQGSGGDFDLTGTITDV